MSPRLRSGKVYTPLVGQNQRRRRKGQNRTQVRFSIIGGCLRSAKWLSTHHPRAGGCRATCGPARSSMDLEMENEHAPSPPAYIDPRSGQTYSLSEPRWRSDEGLPLMITPLPGIGRGDIHSGTRSLWRYAASFPVPVANPVTMGEGCTPLVEHQWRGGRARFKLEWFAPTGSFKDRGASVMISALRQQGVTRLLEDSSGNGGAAIAAYAAAGGIKAKILVPAHDAARQNRPNEGIRGGGRTDPGHPSGHGRRGRAPSRADFLRQPQLAGLLPPGDEDVGLRALGRPRVPGARQRPHTHRRRQQRPRMRHRLLRTPAMRGDQAASSALRGPARELRAALRELRLGR